MMASDPPTHTRLRRLVAGRLTPSRVEQLRPRVAQIAESLVDCMGEHGQIDLVEGYAAPLAITVVQEVAGLPPEAWEIFRQWSVAASAPATASSDLFSRLTDLVCDQLTVLIKDKRASPGDDLLSDLIVGRYQDDGLTGEEIVASTLLMLGAGFETTSSLIGTALYHLLSHPEQLAQLRSQPSILPGAIEEVLRYDSPAVTASPRFAAEEMRIGDVTISPGSMVLLAVASAGRDPDWIHQPEEFDITRSASRHLAFGRGIHYCLGAALARMECEVAIETLLSLFCELHLALPPDSLPWRIDPKFRCLSELPVAYYRRGLQR